ncbi:MAG: IS4 family transposase, partial [Anaerolinea sp.]
MRFATMAEAFANIGEDFSLTPFDTILQPLLEETLQEQGHHKWRKGTILIPKVLVWLVLVLTLRRDLNYDKALNWMLSGLRWLTELLPAHHKIVEDGAISHARVKLGVSVFQVLFAKLVARLRPLPADFHGRSSVVFDGSTGTMPDTEANRDAFGQPPARRGAAAFPQVRLMALLGVAHRVLLAVAYAPYSGKGTGERALLLHLLTQLGCQGLLFLLDAGLYSVELLWHISQRHGEFIVKMPAQAQPKLRQRLPDGSWLAELTGKVQDPTRPPAANGRRHWQTVTLTVRIIRIEIPGFRPFRLLTNLVDPSISAREIALHYHRRWDIEIAYDEIKTHQCATLRGQSPTTFRSKRPDLVKQEVYALAIMYNLIRALIRQAAEAHAQDPCAISFLDTLQHLIDAAPLLTACPPEERAQKCQTLLRVIADCVLARSRRPRCNPRVIKVKMSNWPCKNATHKSETRDIVKELKIIDVQP